MAPEDRQAELYAMELIPTFEITLSEACMEFVDETGEYCEGSLRYVPAGEGSAAREYPRVGVRLKGHMSFRAFEGKASFKIKLDEYVESTRLHGVRRLTLNNMVDDPSMVHEVITYRFMRAAGVPAPLANHAWVRFNGLDYGLYASIESVDDEFVERVYGGEVGNLYESADYGVDVLPEFRPSVSAGFELETNKAQNDTADLEALIGALAAADEGSDADFYDVAAAHLDWPEFLAAAAADAIAAHWDDYFSGTNNYKLYREPARDRFVILPWGTDQTLGANDVEPDDPLTFLHYAYDHSSSGEKHGVILTRCLAHPRCLTEYRAAVEAALAVWESLPLVDELERTLARIAPLRAADPRREYDEARMNAFIDGVRTFVAERGPIVRAQLAQAR